MYGLSRLDGGPIATLGWKPVGNPITRLQRAIDECLAEWGDDPAYKDAGYKLRQVERELDVMVSSPGAREARRAAYAKPSGQEPMGSM